MVSRITERFDAGQPSVVTRGQPHPSLARIFTALYDLARMPYGPTCFLLASIVVAMLSVFTFSQRKSYLQK
jgi:hypothetical protein